MAKKRKLGAASTNPEALRKQNILAAHLKKRGVKPSGLPFWSIAGTPGHKGRAGFFYKTARGIYMYLGGSFDAAVKTAKGGRILRF